MTIIQSYTDQRFLLNGIEYFRNFLPYVSGDLICIYNAYDFRDQRVKLSHFSSFQVNGATYPTAKATQSALLDVIYTRGSLTPSPGGSGNNTKSYIFSYNEAENQSVAPGFVIDSIRNLTDPTTPVIASVVSNEIVITSGAEQDSVIIVIGNINP